MTGGRRTLLWRLGLALMATQAVAAILLGAHSFQQLRRIHQAQTEESLRQVAPLVQRLLDPTDRERLTAQVDALAAHVGLRLTVIDPNGLVLADSESDPAVMDNHRYRPEIDQALREGSGTATRFSATLGRGTVYVAVRVPVEGEAVAVVRVSTPAATVNVQIAQVFRVIAPVALLVFALTLAVIYIVSRRLSTTMSRLATSAGRFAAGDLAHRVDRPPGRELGALAESLNRMAEQLSVQIDQLDFQRSEQRAILQSMSNGVLAVDFEQRILSINRAASAILDVDGATARRGRLLQELVREPELFRFVADTFARGSRMRREVSLGFDRAASIELTSEPLDDAAGTPVGMLVLLNDVTRLRQLEGLRRDFAANVSHELRTPITIIKGYVETLLDMGMGDAEQTRRSLEVIHRNTGRLGAIIEDLLSLARLEEEDAPAHLIRESVDVAAVVDAALAQTADTLARTRITVRRDLETGLTVMGAPQLLEQALANLLTNALNYGGEGTTVTISAGRVDGSVELAVADEGPGIGPEHLPRLFERFYRVDRARSRALGGTGLGLAIVKHIANVHGGRAEVESTVGAGSTFRIVLPAEAPGERPLDSASP